MESNQQQIETTSLSSPVLPDFCPISALLGKRLSQYSDEELEAHTIEVRAARESPQILRSLLAAGAVKKKKAEAKKPNLSILGL